MALSTAFLALCWLPWASAALLIMPCEVRTSLSVRPELVEGVYLCNAGFDGACPEPIKGLSPNGELNHQRAESMDIKIASDAVFTGVRGY